MVLFQFFSLYSQKLQHCHPLWWQTDKSPKSRIIKSWKKKNCTRAHPWNPRIINWEVKGQYWYQKWQMCIPVCHHSKHPLGPFKATLKYHEPHGYNFFKAFPNHPMHQHISTTAPSNLHKHYPHLSINNHSSWLIWITNAD